ncbi:unnamed protein product [Sphenostylis stenocarpa]|uniref:Uncharacterized protein n=1 Tax=Sphenostylis stenocarpa TaxID=92480 RepID=A0AA86W4N9_9FABA|nr:unnamed protein product [Sphenostylis stenocarpa]
MEESQVHKNNQIRQAFQSMVLDDWAETLFKVLVRGYYLKNNYNSHTSSDAKHVGKHLEQSLHQNSDGCFSALQVIICP